MDVPTWATPHYRLLDCRISSGRVPVLPLTTQVFSPFGFSASREQEPLLTLSLLMVAWGGDLCGQGR